MAAQANAEDSRTPANGAPDSTPPSNTPPQETHGEGLTVREAAQRSGMTEKMIRVRIRNGSIESWKVQGKFGPEWRVRLPEEDATTPAASEAPAGNAPSEEPAAPASEPPSPPPPRSDQDAAVLPPAPSAGGASPASATPAAMPLPGGVTVPVDLFHDLIVRHEEVSIRLGRAEALLETLNENAAPLPAPATPEPPAEPREARDARENREAVSNQPVAPNQSVERLQRIARGEAEARHRAEAEVARLRQQLQAAERTIEDLQGVIRSTGGTG